MAQGEKVLGWNEGDIAALDLGHTSLAPRGHSDKGWALGCPLTWAADANQASCFHCLAWKQGFQKHTLLVNKPKERKTSLEANKGAHVPGPPGSQDSEGGPSQAREAPSWPVWPCWLSHPQEQTQPLGGDVEVRSPGIEPWRCGSQLTVLMKAGFCTPSTLPSAPGLHN